MPLIQKLFIKNHDQLHLPKVREAYGSLSSIIGILTNLALAGGKFFAGTLSSSIAITSDAWNNLTDAISSLISLISFKISNKPPDANHPFGHARTEYIASSGVALIILVVAYELAKESIQRILHPVEIQIELLTLAILFISILIKLSLWNDYRYTGRLINSQVLLGASLDSLSDVLATSVVLISMLTARYLGLQLDGWMGLVVAGFIFIAGFKNMRETFTSILGTAPSEEMVNQIEQQILKHDGVLAIHDLVVHDYGPGRTFASVHVEVDGTKDVMVSHELIDSIEREIALITGIHLVIHMDPLLLDDPYINQKRGEVQKIIQSINCSLSIHDFRVVRGSIHTNLLFDVLVPDHCEIKDDDIKKEITNGIKNLDEDLSAIITIDRSYIGLPSGDIK